MSILVKLGDVFFVVFAYPFFKIFLFFYGDESIFNSRESAQRAKHREKASKAAMKERKRSEPLALPPKSLDLSLWPHKKISTPTAEITPLLLQLPFEIREKIYSEVLGYGTLHLIQLPKRLGHLRCTASDTSYTDGNIICSRKCFHPFTPIQTYHYGEPRNVNCQSDNSLALLQTSRQIYSEASLILYQTNTFDINHPQTLHFLARTIRASRLSSIRYLNLTWSGVLPFIQNDSNREPDDLRTWEEAWGIIAEKMTDLRTLKLRMLIYEDEFQVNGSAWSWRLARGNTTTSALYFEKILESVKKRVRGLREFHLGVELPEDVLWNVGELEARLRGIVCTPGF